MIKTLPQVGRILACQHKVSSVKHGCIGNSITSWISHPYLLTCRVSEHKQTISGTLLNQIASKKPPPPICWNPKAKSPESDAQKELLSSAVRDDPKVMLLHI